MWALRRASTHFRNQGLTSRTGQIFCGKTEIARCCSAGLIEPQEELFDGLLACTRSYSTSSSFLKLHREVRTFLSRAGAKSTGDDCDDDLEDGFFELGTPQETAQGAASEDENNDDLSEEGGTSDDILNETETETIVGEKKISSGASSTMAKAILAAPDSPVSKVLDKWVEEGNEVTQTKVSLAMSGLHRRRLYVKALQLSEWLESGKLLEFDVKSYATRVDLIAKLHGPYKAENYIEKIPEAFRSETVYSTLFANYVSSANIKKSEELFNKMKDLGFPITCTSCNQLLRLYKRNLKKKIGDVLQLMEKENIKPSLITYQILIDVKGQDNDINGMEKVIETMKADGFEPNTQIQASLARYYAANGLKEKAESVLKEMEGSVNNRWIYQKLIPIYASLGKEDEVDRIWKVCESDPRFEECMALIEAWGQLNKIENAEVAFDNFLKNTKKPSSKLFTSLLKVYTNHKMLAKGKDLTKRMVESGCKLGPVTWDALVKLCVAAGEVEKAMSILGKAVRQKRGRPLFCSFIAIMEEYADRGDVHNAEKIFLMMKQAGYTSRVGLYKPLIRAYEKAKAPAYGFRDRMKADNVFPNQAMASQLARLEGFKKSAVDDLLD